MIQWIRGRITASYVGERSTLILPSGGAGQRRYRPRVYRAAVHDVQWIASPADARPPHIEDTTNAGGLVESQPHVEPVYLASAGEHVDFRQPRIDEVHVAGIRGGGTFFLGALFDVRVHELELSYPTEQGGQAYGLMTGMVTACLVLPPPPELEHAPASKLVESVSAPLAAGELHVEANERTTMPAEEAELAALAGATMAAPAQSGAESALAPWLAVAAAVCLMLALTCGFLPALLWTIFMLPTVVARRFFVGVLPDTRGVRIFGVVLVAVQLVCTASLLHAWWAGGCRELAILPLLGVIALLFPVGLMPSPIPLTIHAASLALILFGWCSGGSGRCSDASSPRDAVANVGVVAHCGNLLTRRAP